MTKPKNSAEDYILEAIKLFGKEAVKDATKKYTKPKLGRRPTSDWRPLEPFLTPDIADWIAGKDPIQERSNHQIAVKFAEAHPEVIKDSVRDRIRLKLGRNHSQHRKMWGLTRSMIAARENQSYVVYVRILLQLSEINRDGPWDGFLLLAIRAINRYTDAYGQPPIAHSICILEDEVTALDPILKTGLLAYAHYRNTVEV
ncbi:MAG: hypothetical protein ABJ242_04035 [Marinomonas sp.]